MEADDQITHTQSVPLKRLHDLEKEVAVRSAGDMTPEKFRFGVEAHAAKLAMGMLAGIAESRIHPEIAIKGLLNTAQSLALMMTKGELDPANEIFDKHLADQRESLKDAVEAGAFEHLKNADTFSVDAPSNIIRPDKAN